MNVTEERIPDSINVLTQMISLYTKEQDEYDRNSPSLIMKVITILGALVAGSIALLNIKASPDTFVDIAVIYQIESFIFLIFPAMATLFMFVFALNSRKIAVYRGYLDYLERCANHLVSGGKIQLDTKNGKDNDSLGLLQMNSRLWCKFLYGKNCNFYSGKIQDFATAVFGIVFYAGAYAISYYFYTLATGYSSENYNKLYPVILWSLVILCTGSLIPCLIDLCRKVRIRDDVAQYCPKSDKEMDTNRKNIKEILKIWKNAMKTRKKDAEKSNVEQRCPRCPFKDMDDEQLKNFICKTMLNSDK